MFVWAKMPRLRLLIDSAYYKVDYTKHLTRTRMVIVKTVIVLGMARTGTSLITGILHYLGVKMCAEDEAKETDEFNRRGYFQNTDFKQLNGLFYPDWKREPPSIMKTKLLASLRKQRLKCLFEKHQTAEIWGFKDAKTSFIIEAIYPYLKNPYFIISLRPAWAVASSFYKRNGISDKISRKRWEQSYIRIFKFLSKNNDPFIVMEYYDIIEKPNDNIRRLIDFLRIKPNEEEITRALSFITKDLCHENSI